MGNGAAAKGWDRLVNFDFSVKLLFSRRKGWDDRQALLDPS
jgi:hypothetical protein